MDNQHRKISGYRELSEKDIALMNKIKSLGPLIEGAIDDVKAHVASQRKFSTIDGEVDADAARSRLDSAQPERWTAIGTTHFQEGLMALTRAVAQPTFF